jgi:hypothetical protein
MLTFEIFAHIAFTKRIFRRKMAIRTIIEPWEKNLPEVQESHVMVWR